MLLSKNESFLVLFFKKERAFLPIDDNGNLHYVGSPREESGMTTLTVTARGQVTFRKDVLRHLGIRPGEKIEVDKLPDGRVALRAARPSGTIDGFLGLLAGKTGKVATLDEIDDAAAAGWAGTE
jgi:AbrB family looped-hinge helix DNA binding protein